MKNDAFSPVQYDSYIPETDVTSTSKGDEESWELGYVLRE